MELMGGLGTPEGVREMIDVLRRVQLKLEQGLAAVSEENNKVLQPITPESMEEQIIWDAVLKALSADSMSKLVATAMELNFMEKAADKLAKKGIDTIDSEYCDKDCANCEQGKALKEVLNEEELFEFLNKEMKKQE